MSRTPLVDPVAAVNAAAPNRIAEAIARLSATERIWPLVDESSSIRNFKADQLIRSKYRSQGNVSDRQDLCNYAAHLSMGHLMDGWRYLSQSLLALSRGARPKSVHLAYYAELRAALSLLASNGIVIHNGKNYSIKSDGKIAWFQGRTHEVAWQAIEAWASRPDSADTVFKAFSFGGLNGGDWVGASEGEQLPIDLSQKWVTGWAVDLSNLREDSATRNLASYNPKLAEDALTPLSTDDLKVLISFGAAFFGAEPNSHFDRAVLKNLISMLGKKSSRNRNRDYINDLKKKLVVNGSFNDASKANEAMIELHNSLPIPIQNIITWAAGHSGENAGPENLMSRSFMLLRLATTIAVDRSKEAAREKDGEQAVEWLRKLLLKFAISANCVRRNGALEEALSEGELASSLQAINTAAQSNPLCGFEVWQNNAPDLISLTSTERICIRSASVH